MNITVFYATGRKEHSSTYQIAQMLIKEFLEGGTCFEFQLLRDMPHVCTGCYACIHGQEQKCGGAAFMTPVLAAMEQSQLILFCAPTYVYHVPGQMKTLLDHFGYRWLVHRPDLSFMKKQAIIINTAAGGGMKGTVRDIKDSTDNLGIARTHCLSQSVWDYNWKDLPESFKRSVHRKVKHTVKKVRRCSRHLTPSFKVWCLFTFYRFLHKHGKMSPVDDAYWRNQGYNMGVPWKN